MLILHELNEILYEPLVEFLEQEILTLVLVYQLTIWYSHRIQSHLEMFLYTILILDSSINMIYNVHFPS